MVIAQFTGIGLRKTTEHLLYNTSSGVYEDNTKVGMKPLVRTEERDINQNLETCT